MKLGQRVRFSKKVIKAEPDYYDEGNRLNENAIREVVDCPQTEGIVCGSRRIAMKGHWQHPGEDNPYHRSPYDFRIVFLVAVRMNYMAKVLAEDLEVVK